MVLRLLESSFNNRVCNAPIFGLNVGSLHVAVRNHPPQPLPSRERKRDGHTAQPRTVRLRYPPWEKG